MNKKILFLVLSVVLCIVLIITGITVGQKSNNGSPSTETPKPPVTLSPPQTDTNKPPLDTSSQETVPPPPYGGRTFTVVAPNNGELFLGDGIGGDTVSEAVYQRNLSVCLQTGVTMLFKYSLDVYADTEASSLSGSLSPDLVMLNMRSDGSRFLMNGGLMDVSSLYPEMKLPKSLKTAGKQYFIIGDVTPSFVTSLYRLKVKADSGLVSPLTDTLENGTLTLEALFEMLAENEKQLSLGETGIHALLSDGLFLLSDDGNATVDADGYAQRAIRLSRYRAYVNEGSDAEAEICIGTYSGDGYVYFSLPTYDTESVGPVCDTSALYPFALLSGCPDIEMSVSVLTLMTELSHGFGDLAASEYGLPDGGENAVYCFYDIFGWGDFSRHAYKAFLENRTDSLKKTLEAPTRASLQALLILFERNS